MGIRFIPVDPRKFPYREPRQPRAPQAVRSRETRCGQSYEAGFADGAVVVLAGLLLFGLIVTALWAVLR